MTKLDRSKQTALRSAFVPHKRVFAPLDYEVSMTRQEMADECDVNKIMAQYKKYGTISHVMQVAPQYGDFADLPDFQEALGIFARAQESFSALPAEVRKEFDNDPAKFVAYVDGGDHPDDREKRLERMRSWGLADVPAPDPAPMRVEVVNPPQDVPKAE